MHVQAYRLGCKVTLMSRFPELQLFDDVSSEISMSSGAESIIGSESPLSATEASSIDLLKSLVTNDRPCSPVQDSR